METYKSSFVGTHSPTTKAILGDLSQPGVVSRLKEIVGNQHLDVLIGGPPCQDFSPARLRHRRRMSRMGLIGEYLKILGDFAPTAFLFENVPGLLAVDGGSHWEHVLHECENMGYLVLGKVLDAQEHGVPQRRRRLFVVGIASSRGMSFRFPVPTEPTSNVWQTIGKLLPLEAGEVDPNDPDHLARNHRPATVEYLKQIGPGQSWRDVRESRVLDCHKGHNGHYDVYGRMEGDRVAPTITGGCTNPSKGRFIHPTQNRGITVREAALLQTFPPDWHFFGGIEAASRQVGNAVPINLGRKLAAAMRVTLRAATPISLSKVDEIDAYA